jgi:putative FmdB family regulatory protein
MALVRSRASPEKEENVPLYEYACRQCGRVFEDLVFGKAPAPVCPACSGADVERLLSRVAVGRAEGAAAAGPAAGACGSCGDPRGPGACARN